MKTTILVDNDAQEGLGCEWGFSALIETDGATILLDSGASGLFSRRMRRPSASIWQMSTIACSPAHFDHADGFGDSSQSRPRAAAHPELMRGDVLERCQGDMKSSASREGFSSSRHCASSASTAPAIRTWRMAPGP